MPELPEVETLRRELNSALKGRTVKSAEVNWHKMVKPLTIPEFCRKIIGQKILNVGRRSKVLVIDFAGPLSLAIHLKMTGQLIYRVGKLANRPAYAFGLRRGKQVGKFIVGGHPQNGGLVDLPNKFTHLTLYFTDGSVLFFNDLRKFGWARLIDDRGVAEIIEAHGPEPLTKEFSLKYFESMIKKYPNRKIKQILMDQKHIGGIGNIYADESCFCAKILPAKISKKIKPAEIFRLYRCINSVIKLAIAKKGTSADTYVRSNGKPGDMVPYLKVYGREGEKCKRCGGVVKKIKLNGRGTHFCPQCQK